MATSLPDRDVFGVDVLASSDTAEMGESGEMANFTEVGLLTAGFVGACSWKICEFANTASTSGASIGTLV